MEKEQIKAIYDGSKPQSVRNIEVFLWVANFYQRFIQGFIKLFSSLISMLKTTAKVSQKDKNPKQSDMINHVDN